MMDNKTRGAWIVHHAQKLQQVTGVQGDFENISVAGKMGSLLSSLAVTDQSILTWDQVNALARAEDISVQLELQPLVRRLEERRLIQTSSSGLEVIAVSTSAVLEHTATAFDSFAPSRGELAVLDLAERVSVAPSDTKAAAEYLGDTYKIPTLDAAELLNQSEQIGFVDAETLAADSKLLFNGHLFRRDAARKVQAVLQSLSSEDTRRAAELENLLKQQGCMELTQVKSILGADLFEKLNVIGMFDVNEVSNLQESVLYVTRPAAFGKFGNAFVEDALDLAKAFVTCLTYGMTRSATGRGRIAALSALMGKLISGRLVGPATAIGEDYKILELKRVIQTSPAPGRSGQYYMRLLKRDIGELALQVLLEGDASEHSLPNFPGAAVSRYVSPEVTRTAVRKAQTPPSKRATMSIINDLRTGLRS